jgi:hypothetical protein
MDNQNSQLSSSSNYGIDKVIRFVEDYKKFSESILSLRVESFKKRADLTFGGYKSLKSIFKTYNNLFAPDFNVFSILRMEKKETIVHTPFLLSLLSIDGTHGQGSLFYESFIKVILSEDENRYRFLPDNYDNFYIQENKYTLDGFMDIFISNYSGDKKFAICIENKIDADDQTLQLKRYYEYLKNVLGFEDEQILIVYLSPLGKKPSAYSIDPEMEKDLESKGILVNISYKEQIKEWLELSYPIIKSENVKMIINQYQQIIKNL